MFSLHKKYIYFNSGQLRMRAEIERSATYSIPVLQGVFYSKKDLSAQEFHGLFTESFQPVSKFGK